MLERTDIPGLKIEFNKGPKGDLQNFLEEMANMGRICIITIAEQDYFVYVEKTEKS